MSVIRTVTPNEKSKMMECFVSAFITDPTIRFIYPEATEYFSSYPHIQELHNGDSLISGTTFTVEEFCGVAALIGPADSANQEAMLGHILSSVAVERAEEFLTVIAASNVNQPDEPHWYLAGIAVDPYYQGKGYGLQLMEHALKMIDQEHLPVYLESSNPANISLYQRLGFKICESYKLGGRPIYTPMIRPAQ